jgi:hypothetical protein
LAPSKKLACVMARKEKKQKKKRSPGDQDQHRVSEVYLKQFGYQNNKHWKISTAELSKRDEMRRVGRLRVSQKSIGSVTIATNEFDLIGLSTSVRRLLEQEFQKLETVYEEILLELNNESIKSTSSTRLNMFIASLLIRSRRFREMVNYHIRQPHSNKFLRDMCIGLDPEYVNELVQIIEAVPIENRLNHACVLVWNHLSYILSHFNSVFIKDYETGWQTSDDPVVMRNNNYQKEIISVDMELYFPLSRNICLFMYHVKARKNTHPLRTHPDLSFVQADVVMRDIFHQIIFENAHDMTFFPERLNLNEPIMSPAPVDR